jgi:D-3-phosphoglycerate dehydrogenase
VSTARGGIVNEPARLAALDAGWIRGAALDVLKVKPPRQDNELLNHEKVILTPHTAANTDEAMSRMAVLAAKEILKVLDGDKPLNVINPEIYL